MTPQEIIRVLLADGIELIADSDKIRVRATKVKITEEQKMPITNNKASLLAHLAGHSNERNCGSHERNEPAPMPTASEGPPANNAYFKEYLLPNGEKLQLTKEEFDRVVDAFRLLLAQDMRKRRTQGVAS